MKIEIDEAQQLTILRALAHYECGTLCLDERERVSAIQEIFLSSRSTDDGIFRQFPKETPSDTSALYRVRVKTIDGENARLIETKWTGNAFIGVHSDEVLSWAKCNQ